MQKAKCFLSSSHSINREESQSQSHFSSPSSVSVPLSHPFSVSLLYLSVCVEVKEEMKAYYVALCTVLVLLVAAPKVSMAVTCNPSELSPCVSAITSSAPPSKLCCSKIKEQRPCLCQYLKNPNLKKFVNNPNARKVANTCGTPFPKC